MNSVTSPNAANSQPKSTPMKITVIGAGYVGLVTAACLAELGHDVTCYDQNSDLTHALFLGNVPIREKDLQPLVRQNLGPNGLRFTSDFTQAVDAEIFIIAVGTPSGADGTADLSAVHSVIATLGKNVNKECVIVNKSTAPIGTAFELTQMFEKEQLARDKFFRFSVVSNPEFLSEGRAVEDFMQPSRIIIGHSSTADGLWARDKVACMYEGLLRPATQNMLQFMSVRSAELTKYAANMMLATRISLMNELAALADETGADIEHVRQGIGTDPRIGMDFLRAGIGYGGSCFPKDVKALRGMAVERQVSSYMATAVTRVNDNAPDLLVNKIHQRFPDIANATFAVWGVSFKAGTNDFRESPALRVIGTLLSCGATLKINCGSAPEIAEGHILEGMLKKMFSDSADRIAVSSTLGVLSNSDALVILTDWEQYASVTYSAFARLKQRVVFDGRNVVKSNVVELAQLEYHSIGRPTVYPLKGNF